VPAPPLELPAPPPLELPAPPPLELPAPAPLDPGDAGASSSLLEHAGMPARVRDASAAMEAHRAEH
jgi:hypothetical protein